jgi:hypothetical protein
MEIRLHRVQWSIEALVGLFLAALPFLMFLIPQA